jgi:hypothetical protein
VRVANTGIASGVTTLPDTWVEIRYWDGKGRAQGMEAFLTHFFGVGEARFFSGIFLRISIYLIVSGYSCELIWIFIQRETSKSEVIQVSVGQRNDIFV